MSTILRIYSDCGHDDAKGKDHGASNNGLTEGNMNQITGAAMDNRFIQHGYSVKSEPGNLSIDQSAAVANAFGANLVISNHENAGGGDRGEVIYSWKSGALKLAGACAAGLRNAGQAKVNLVKSKPNSKGTAEYFGILRNTKAPAVIVEPCFIDNAADRQLADTEEEQRKIGVCVADAIALAYGSPLNDRYNQALNRLAAKGYISSPGYWKNLMTSTLMADGIYLALLIVNMTSKGGLEAGINYLAEKGVISSPDYWMQNCLPGEQVLGAYVQLLLINAVTKLGV